MYPTSVSSTQIFDSSLPHWIWASPMAHRVENLPTTQETQEMRVQSLGWKDPLEKRMSIHSSIAQRIPWTEECGGVQSMGSQRVRHNWATNTTYSVNPGAISLEIRLIKTIQRLVAVSIMGTWKALFVSPCQYTTLKDLEFNRGSLPHPPGHQREPHICVSEGGWAGMHGGGRTGEQWRQTQSTILDSHGSGWACSPREPHSSRGSSYPSFLVTSESVSTGSWAVEAAGPMTPVPPAVAALLSPVPPPLPPLAVPSNPTTPGVVEVLVTLALPSPCPSPCHGINAWNLDDPGCSGSVCPPGILNGNSTLAASRHQLPHLRGTGSGNEGPSDTFERGSGGWKSVHSLMSPEAVLIREKPKPCAIMPPAEKPKKGCNHLPVELLKSKFKSFI